MSTKPLGDEGGGYVPWTLEPETPVAPPTPVASPADINRAKGNAKNICEATFEAMRLKAIQPGALAGVIELRTPFPASTLVAAEHLADLYTARFGGNYEVRGLSLRPEGGTLTILARIASTR